MIKIIIQIVLILAAVAGGYGYYTTHKEKLNATSFLAILGVIQEEVIASHGESLINKITTQTNSEIKECEVEIVTAQIKTLNLLKDNEATVCERMISEKENITTGYIANGQEEAQKIRHEPHG